MASCTIVSPASARGPRRSLAGRARGAGRARRSPSNLRDRGAARHPVRGPRHDRRAAVPRHRRRDPHTVTARPRRHERDPARRRAARHSTSGRATPPASRRSTAVARTRSAASFTASAARASASTPRRSRRWWSTTARSPRSAGPAARSAAARRPTSSSAYGTVYGRPCLLQLTGAGRGRPRARRAVAVKVTDGADRRRRSPARRRAARPRRDGSDGRRAARARRRTRCKATKPGAIRSNAGDGLRHRRRDGACGTHVRGARAAARPHAAGGAPARRSPTGHVVRGRAGRPRRLRLAVARPTRRASGPSGCA